MEEEKGFDPELDEIYTRLDKLPTEKGNRFVEDFFDVVAESIRESGSVPASLRAKIEALTQIVAALPVEGAVQTPERSVEQQLEEIDKSIILRGVKAKLNKGTFMYGQNLVPEDPHLDFQSYPKEVGDLFFDGALRRSDSITDVLRESPQAEIKNLYRKHLIIIEPFRKDYLKRGKDFATVNFVFRQDGFDHANRPKDIVQTIFVMPTAQATRLQELIVVNPDMAESFFQKAAAGLDRTSEAASFVNPQEQPNVGRFKSDEVVIIDSKKIVPDSVFYNEDRTRLTNDMNVRDYIHNTFGTKIKSGEGVTRLKYSKPYGVVEMPPSF